MVSYKFLNITCTVIGFAGIIFVIFQKDISDFVRGMAVFFCILIVIFGYIAPMFMKRLEKESSSFGEIEQYH